MPREHRGASARRRCCCGLLAWLRTGCIGRSDAGRTHRLSSSSGGARYQAPALEPTPGSPGGVQDRGDGSGANETGPLLPKGAETSSQFQQRGFQTVVKGHRRTPSSGSPKKNKSYIEEIFGQAMTEEDDDVCPTCLDPYTEDNPKVVTKCGHLFHLPCIYEWMERSNVCPICDARIELDEELM